jgi:hypothetical protein
MRSPGDQPCLAPWGVGLALILIVLLLSLVRWLLAPDRGFA